LLLFGGCALVEGGGPSPRLFTPHPKTTFDSDLPNAGWQLVIDPPLAPASIDTVRIAVRKSPLELDYYAGAAWADRVPPMVQTLLVSSFENSGKIVGVGRESASLRGDFALRSDIRNFEVESEGGHTAAHVHIVSKLIQLPERIIVSDNSCDYKEEAASGALEAIVEAYNSALGRCMRRIVEWTLRTGTKIKPAK
jgi:cholesterol transport system auxiliary component